MAEFLSRAFVYLVAAVIAVPIAKRLGLGSVLGYLLAGVVLGPVAGLVGAETRGLQQLAELGVVMMLFLVGLELQPRALLRMRAQLGGLGGLQVCGTAAVLAGAAVALGQPWRVAVGVGLVLSLSSTAIVLQTLSEKGLTKTPGGRAAFAVLLFQDIAVIPMLAVLPLLAAPALAGEVGGHGNGHAESASLLEQVPGWAHGPVVLGAVTLVVVGGHFLSRPLFRLVARAHLRELFTATALLLVAGIALLMMRVGLSPALGTFLAGVVLADSEYRHELESDLEPFKGLLLGLFFITVGAGIDLGLLRERAAPIVGGALGLVALKGLVLAGVTRAFRLSWRDGLLVAFGLGQAGEFCFVMLEFGARNHVFPAELARSLALVVPLSRLLTPLLFLLRDRLAALVASEGGPPDADAITDSAPVIIAGHGRFGQIVNRLLLANGQRTVVLDHQSEHVDGMRRFGVRTFYGDATRPDLLHAAGLAEARVLVVAIDDPERAVQLVSHVRRERPDLCVVARASDRRHLYALVRAGATHVVRETFDSAVRAGKLTLEAIGMHPFQVEKVAKVFVRHDVESLARLAELWDPARSVFENPAYIAVARERNEILEAAVRGSQNVLHDRAERSWTPPPRPGEPPRPTTTDAAPVVHADPGAAELGATEQAVDPLE